MSITNLNGVRYTPQTLTSEQQAQVRQNIGAEQVQSDWNQSDDTAVDYIKNKPSVAVDEIPLRMTTHSHLLSTSADATVNRPSNCKTYKDGQLVTTGSNVNIGSRYMGAYVGVDIIDTVPGHQIDHLSFQLQSLTDNSVTLIERWGDQNKVFLNTSVPNNFAGKLIAKLHNHGYRKITQGTGYSGPMNVDLTTFYDYYMWTSYQSSNSNKLVGKIVFPNLSLPTVTDTMDTIPDMQYCTGIYLHRSKVDAWKTWLAGLYVANTDLTSIYNLIIPYDFVAWYNEFTPDIVTLPTT